MLKIETPLEQIKGITPKFLLKLKKLEINTVRDLLWHFPSRYEDFSQVCKIGDLSSGEQVTVCGTIESIDIRHSFRRRMVIIEASIADETGNVKAVWFNQPYLRNILRPGRYAHFAGKVSVSDDEIFLSNPTYELVQNLGEFDEEPTDTKHTARLVPIYPETKGLTSKGLRYFISPILKETRCEEFFPENVLIKYGLPEINTAINNIHFPENIDDALLARKRFIFENLFLLQLSNLRQKLLLQKERTHSVPTDSTFLDLCLSRLPFELTDSQKRSLKEVLEDIARSMPMNRLLQGDVGSGKTIVAALAAMQAAKQGLQIAFLAPTEILARQHFNTLKKFFAHCETSIGLLSSSGAHLFYGENLESETPKAAFLKEVAQNKLKIVVGTHSLIQKNVDFCNLGLVIIDEQHRFGVDQRASLLRRKNTNKPSADSHIPHLLSMSATPIPRTLMLTIFGDLDISMIDEVPKGRKPVITKVVLPQNRRTAYGFVKGELKKGRQAFVVCPRIEVPDNEDDAAALEIKAVKQEYEKLSKKIFPEFKVAMLHGKMKPQEKKAIMKEFSDGSAQILVSTSVIEVGVDIPNASIMLIEGAERFGLAQLYQFRGRIGRGTHQSFCILFTESAADQTQARLKALIEAKNGFELAEQDLNLRGPGEFIGRKQTGTPDILMNSLQDMQVIRESREAAMLVMEKDQELSSLPLLREKLNIFKKKIHLE